MTSFEKKQQAYSLVYQKWMSRTGPFPNGYQVGAEAVGWISFCEGVEYGKSIVNKPKKRRKKKV